MKYVINDESVISSHGFYLINEGGDFTRFNSNPVMLFAHDESKPIGMWEDLRIEGSELIATPNFDSDEPSQIIKDKIEKGSLKRLSVGLYIKDGEWRVNPTTGESELYVTGWEMLEISVVSLPSNPKSLIGLRLYNSEK